MIEPYYSDSAVSLYLGDCRDVLPSLPLSHLLLTDPPYGIASVGKGGREGRTPDARAHWAMREVWDAAPPTQAVIDLALSKATDAVIWGGNYFTLPSSRGWLVWNKPERNFSLAEAELAWTSRDMVIRVADLPRSDPGGRDHPTQKPLVLMRWCLSFFPKAQTILDPYAGSGTTLRAAKDEGRQAIGIEINERYCEVAAMRLGQGVLDFSGTIA